MFKKWLIEKGIKLLVAIIALGIGVGYMSHSIGGASVSYTSIDTFMNQITKDGDLASVNGCLLCSYIQQMFKVIGEATEMFWLGIVKHLWILMAVGFGIFIIVHTINFFKEQATSKDVKDLTDKQPQLEFSKWFDKVWKTGVRVLIAGALIGAINWGGTAVLKATTEFIITPVMYLGSLLSMAATGVISGSSCELATNITTNNALVSVLQPFMCVIGNLNTVMLAGAGGGFALMNYSWMGLGGGFFTWVAGLGLVIVFLIIGFDVFFQVLSVIFKLIFIIIFMPFMIAATAFEQVWALAKTVMSDAITMLINSAVSILKISLKIIIIYAVVFFAADRFYPGPEDGFTSILPPLLTTDIIRQNPDEKTMSVINVFTQCEHEATINGDIDKDKFKTCFITQKNIVEARYPGAFDFMDDGFSFLLFMIGVFVLYFWIVSPSVDKLLNASKNGKEPFDYGQWVKDVGKTAYNAPGKAFNAIRDKIKEL